MDAATPPRPRPRRRRRAGTAPALAAALLAAADAGAQVRLPDFGDSSEATMSAADERRIGEAFMREVRASLTVVDDPEVDEYVQSLGYSLVSGSPGGGDYRFFVIADEAINAFAAPGGYIGINSGLILVTESESELASVLAHEVAHVSQRHIARSIEAADRSNPFALAGLIAAIVLGTQIPEAGKAAAAAVVGSSVQRQIDFTRQNEQEADRVGMQILADADYDPRAMANFFEKLATESRYYRQPPEFLSTHPVTTNRIADARSRAEQYPSRERESGLDYRLVRAKLRVATVSDKRDALAWFDDALAQAGDAAERPAAEYGRALALGELSRHEEARDVLARLVEAYPERIAFRAALADSELRTGDVQRALALYSDGLALYPDDRTLVRGYARALLGTGRAGDALALIEEYRELYSLDAPLYRLLAEAHGQLGNEVRAQAALAEHYYRTGRLDAAIHQLRLASRHPDQDFYRASRIDARLAELEEEKALRTRR